MSQRALWWCVGVGWMAPILGATVLAMAFDSERVVTWGPPWRSPAEPWILQGALFVATVAFLLGAVVSVRAWRRAPRTGRLYVATALEVVGLACVVWIVAAGFHTDRSYTIDASGRVVSSSILPRELESRDGLASFRIRRWWFWHSLQDARGYVDASGVVRIPPIFEMAGSFNEGLARVERDGRAGFIDTEGKWVIPQVYDALGYAFSEGKVGFKRNGRWGFLDRENRVVIEPAFEEVSMFVEDRAAVRLGDLWGFIDGTGMRVIDPRFDSVLHFSEGFAAVELDGLWGFVDLQGRLVVPPRYDEAFWFQRGLARVGVAADDADSQDPLLRFRYGFIDTFGRVIVEPKYLHVTALDDGTFEVEVENGWMTMDREGNVLSTVGLDDE